jgi:chromate transport protein ChrA
VFSKSAVVTFGGGYAVLGYIAQQAVTRYGWIGAKDMIVGLWESLLAVGLWLPPLDSNQ